MLFGLLLARASFLPRVFFLFLVIPSKFLVIPVVKEKIKVKLAFTVPTGAPITVVKEIIDTPPLFAETTIEILSMQSNAADAYFLILYCLTFFL